MKIKNLLNIKSISFLAYSLMITASLYTTTITNAVGESVTTSLNKTSLTEGVESYPGYLDTVEITTTISGVVAGSTQVTVTGTVTNPCKMTSQSKGPVNYTNSQSASTTNLGNGTNTNLGVYVPDTSSYEGTRTCTVSFTVNSDAEPAFNSVSVPSLTLSIIDDEPAPTPSSTSSPTANPVQSTNPTTQTSNAVPEQTTNTKPDIPVALLVDSDGNELVPEAEGEKVEFESGKPIILSGTTVPNGEVKLYIFSEPKEATVIANEEGVWTYTIQDLESGDHRVEVEVTDPATGETSDRTEVLAFTVAQAEVEPTEETTVAITTTNDELEEDDDSSPIVLILALTVLLLCLGAVGFLWWRRKKNKVAVNEESTTSTSIDQSVAPVEPETESQTNNDTTE